MNIEVTKTVRELAVELPAATRIFEKLGIDYCCGGNRSLQEACGVANLHIQDAVEQLKAAAIPVIADGSKPNWLATLLADVIAHIKNKHHKYTSEEIARLCPLFEKVCLAHGDRHSELLEAREKFRELTQELSTHMIKEEMVLFPYIERMEEAVIEGRPILPAPFGTVKNPVAMMVHEHDLAGDLLCSLRGLTNGYQPPADACQTYKTLYSALAQFEQDLHQHVHLENNILFPRAIEMEKRC